MPKKAVILRTETVIPPFDEHVSESFFSGETLRESQDRALLASGFEVNRVDTPEAALRAVENAGGDECLLMLDRIYVSEKAVRDFQKAAKKLKPPVALALVNNASVDYTRPLQDLLDETSQVVHDVFRVDGAELPPAVEDAVEWMHVIRKTARRCLVPMREIVVEIPLPVIPGTPGERPVLRYPVTSTVVVSIEHWVHILWLNQIAFGIRWMELLRKRPLWALSRVLRSFNFDREKLLERMVEKGKRVRIHPTAYVAGSILGDDVVIGPHATVKNSIVASGSIVQDHAVLLNSVVGERCLITENTFAVSIVSYPESTIGNYKMQVSLIGRGAYINAWVGFVDAKFVGAVQVKHRDGLVSTERQFLGSVVGHRARVAAKVLIQAGREIPNDTTIVMRPDEIVSTVPDEITAGRPMVRDRGTLVPLGEESRS